MGEEGLVGTVDDLRLVPELHVVIVIVAINLGQGKWFPIDLDRLSCGLFYFRQPHGCVVDEWSTEVVKGGELGVGHTGTSLKFAGLPILMAT